MARPKVTRKSIAGELLTFSIPEAGRKVGLGRSASYAAAKRGELPVVWFGGLARVPKAALTKRLEQTGTRQAVPRVPSPSNKNSKPRVSAMKAGTSALNTNLE